MIQDKRRTPFNIGRAIELNGFEFSESEPLAKGLEGKVSNPQDVLKKVLKWTGGQPFLTQKLCKLILSCDQDLSVRKLVKSRLIKNWESQDDPEHLRTIRDRLLSDKQGAIRLLELYQQILQQRGGIAADSSDEHMKLRLSGLVVKRQDKLQVYNDIYKKVFDEKWVNSELIKLRPPLYAEALKAWSESNHQDNFLLRGQELQEALLWSRNQILSSEDNQFLTASLEFERREYAEALKPYNFKFKYGEAASVFDLISLCDRYSEEAEVHLFNSYLERWLFARGKTDIASLSPNIVSFYQKDKDKGLELFVRGLCEDEGIPQYPEILAQPNELYLGEGAVGFQNQCSLQMSNKGRGFAWGDITIEGNLPGISLPKKFDSSTDKTLDIRLNTIEVKPGSYNGYIVIHLEGISQPCRIPIHYKVNELKVCKDTFVLNLGVISHSRYSLDKALTVTCEPSSGRLKGTVSTEKMLVKVTPSSFEGSSVEFSLTVDTTPLKAGLYQDMISLKTNNGEYQVPVHFIKPLRWKFIAQLTATVSIATGLVLFIIRFILDQYLSTGVDAGWVLSYPPEVSQASFFRVIAPLSIFEVSTLQLRFSALGFFLTTIILFISWFNFNDLFDAINENILCTVQFYNTLKLMLMQWDYNYSRNNKFLKALNILLFITLILIILSTISILNLLLVGLLINFLLNIFAWIGSSFILIVDSTAYPVNWTGINQPAFGWLALGLLLGGIFGLIQSLKYIKEYSSLNKAYKAAMGVFLALILAFITSLIFKPNIDPFPITVLQENFSPSPKSNWVSIYSSKPIFKNGALFHQDGDISIWADQNSTIRDVEFSVDTVKTNGSGNLGFGIIARYTTNQDPSTNNGNYYYLLINGNGQFVMGKHLSNQKRENQVNWHNSITINQGDSNNQLKLVCYKQKIIGWINDQRVGMFEDDSFNFGQIGVISERGNGTPISVYFDNILVREKPE